MKTINTPPFHSHDLDLSSLRRYRLSRVREQLKKRDYAGVVLFDPLNIRYATDTSNMQVWIMHNASRYAFIATEGPVVVFDFHNCEHLSDGNEFVDEVRPVCSWYYFDAGTRAEEKAKRWADEIADLVRQHGGGNTRLALDHCDPLGADALRAHGITLHTGQDVLEEARNIKSPLELEAMRVAIKTCETAMDKMRAALTPGITENQLWSVLHQQNIALGGEWIETRLLTSGPRTNPWFQECSDRIIQAGDIVSFDTDLIGPFGYCADISRSWICGEDPPNDEQRRLYAVAYEQIHHNLQVLHPGLTAFEFVDKSFKLPEQYVPNRYSVVAHGIGLCDEHPAIHNLEDRESSGYDLVLQPGMTLCIESYVGAFGGREGIKLEQQVLITEEGIEDLTTYPFELDWL